ncbi:MAG TPA: hypothetical protein ENK33_04275 [Desulfobacterales bacterium]|nr:hypothetical protein [Desulfobacterales bacterium]
MKIFKTPAPAMTAVLLISLLLTACGQARAPQTLSAASPDFFGIGDNLARQLINNRSRSLNTNETLIFTTIVNLNNLDQTSKFGRALSESLATRLFKYGFHVIELRKAGAIMVKDKTGELILSRESRKLGKEQKADAIVAGTYSLTPKSIIINIKLLAAGTQEVLSVAGMELNRSLNINYLLADGNGPVMDSVSGDEHF